MIEGMKQAKSLKSKFLMKQACQLDDF